MKVRGFKRVAAGVAAASALALGVAVAGAGTAAAESAYEGPELSASQGGEDGEVELTITNNNNDGLLPSSCTSALVDAETGMRLLVAANEGNLGDIADAVGSDGGAIGPAVIGGDGKSNSKNVNVPTGVYIYMGTCGGLESIVPGNIGMSMTPVIVPDGIGSVAPALDFGSLLLQSGDMITDLLPLLGALS